MTLLTRRAGNGVGDGIEIALDPASITGDYRGAQYILSLAIIHIRGVHIFPGQSDVYPAEVHLHMETIREPKRFLTVCIPVDHRITGQGTDFFSALSNQPGPLSTNPRIESILPIGSDIVQYRGPTVLGRTRDTPKPDTCGQLSEQVFLLVLTPVQILPADLERIQTEGSLSTDYRDLPAPGIPHDAKTVVGADRLKKVSSVARPGLLGGPVAGPTVSNSGTPNEYECKPVKVVDGQDVIDNKGTLLDVRKLFGIEEQTNVAYANQSTMDAAVGVIVFVGVMIGILFADWLLGFAWMLYFASGPYMTWEPLKIWFFLLIALFCGYHGAFIVRLFGG